MDPRDFRTAAVIANRDVSLEPGEVSSSVSGMLIYLHAATICVQKSTKQRSQQP